jgi:hypothetical protein
MHTCLLHKSHLIRGPRRRVIKCFSPTPHTQSHVAAIAYMLIKRLRDVISHD